MVHAPLPPARASSKDAAGSEQSVSKPPSSGASLPASGNAEEHNGHFGIEGGRGIETRSYDTAAKKQAEVDDCAPKAGRAKREAAAAAGRSNEASAAKRPRGRPHKGVSVEPPAPKPIATTAARKLRKVEDQLILHVKVLQPASQSQLKPREANAVERYELFGVEGRRRIDTRSSDTVSKEQAEASYGAPKAVGAKRQAAAAADNAAGPSNEAPAAKRPRGRPPKGASAEAHRNHDGSEVAEGRGCSAAHT
ncbi:uncharacterized protein LOC119397437 [Rhipicephalus sanguineus]|uniref:uncharacterized protein LOC119397437 n=1 Tax=Rhipicephalus sanguineus TaxID=34632 RepID=UPI001895DD31|nr:uncharacterized protein LOC119397437 [Rhipicephalus sanguineus]